VLTGGGAVSVFGIGALALLFLLRGTSGASRPDLVLHKVKYERLELTIVERGALESGKNSDIYCRVKAGSKNTTIATQIKMVIDDGSEVHGPSSENPTGDLLVDLDDSGLQEQLKSEKITVDKAESDKIQAEEAYNITVSQNDSDIKTAETKVELATIDLMKYTGLEKEEVLKPATIARLKEELKKATANARRAARDLADEDLKKYQSGDYLAALKDVLGQIENAQSDLSQQEDREAWAYRMWKKGYQTASQAQAETSRKESFQLVVNKTTLQLDVLVKYTKVSQLTAFITALEEAQRTLERTRGQAKSKEVQARIDRAAKKSIWEQERAHYKDIEDEIKKCKIYAPQDGMVVYFVPEQARFGGGSQQSIVAQGEPVREGQKLMQIPDLKNMLVNTKVHEALVSRVHTGQKAQVRVESYPDRVLHGKVASVATVASQQDFMAADVKVYTTKVAIEPRDIEGLDLKPGMSAAVTISVNDALEHVLAVPLQAIVGGAELGAERKVVVMTPAGPQEHSVTVGASTDTMAEIREGLHEGDQVVLNPKAVLGDKIKVHEPGADKGPQIPSGGEGDVKKEKGKGKGKEGVPTAKAGPSGAPGGGWQNMSPEERQKAREKMLESFRKATPEERKRMLEQMPEERRGRVKDGLKAAGIEVPD
jgi:multidrug resistance efflux pump